jgi:hypothetical protein
MIDSPVYVVTVHCLGLDGETDPLKPPKGCRSIPLAVHDINDTDGLTTEIAIIWDYKGDD